MAATLLCAGAWLTSDLTAPRAEPLKPHRQVVDPKLS
jgi:hypothetical protein